MPMCCRTPVLLRVLGQWLSSAVTYMHCIRSSGNKGLHKCVCMCVPRLLVWYWSICCCTSALGLCTTTGDPRVTYILQTCVHTVTMGPYVTYTMGPYATYTMGPYATYTMGPYASYTVGPYATYTMGPYATYTMGPYATYTMGARLAV